jgi:alpha-1,3-glucosyltransferase
VHALRTSHARGCHVAAFVLIDHGHFQYNNISLGLSAAAAAAVLRGRHVLGSVLYTLAFNHKQVRSFAGSAGADLPGD